MKTIHIATTLAVSALMLVSCKEDPLQTYSVGNRACFWTHSATQSLLGATEAEKKTDTITVTVNIMGYLSDEVRHVDGVAVEDPAGTLEAEKLTTAPAGAYKIIGADIPANSTTGDFKVVINNLDQYLGSGQTLKLNVAIAENEDFAPGLKENQTIALSWSRELIKPSTWSTIAKYFCATYSTRAYRIFIEVTGYTECKSAYYGGENNGLFAWARAYGNYIREYNETHPDVLRHDDGDHAGEPIIPIY